MADEGSVYYNIVFDREREDGPVVWRTGDEQVILSFHIRSPLDYDEFNNFMRRVLGAHCSSSMGDVHTYYIPAAKAGPLADLFEEAGVPVTYREGLGRDALGGDELPGKQLWPRIKDVSTLQAIEVESGEYIHSAPQFGVEVTDMAISSRKVQPGQDNVDF